MKKNPLVDVTNITAEEYEDNKVLSLDDFDDVPCGRLFESLIESITNPDKGAGRPALLKVRNNNVIISLLIGIVDVKITGAPEGEVLN